MAARFGAGVEPRVVRTECPGCGTCHSIIASVMSPRSPYTQEIREKAVRELKRGTWDMLEHFARVGQSF
jgi:hypothetical protein